MLDAQTLTRAVDLQQKSYQLIRWVGEAVRKGFIKFPHAYSYASFPDAAEHWIKRHYSELPLRGRPKQEDIPDFSRIFATYLQSSFDLKPNPGTQLYSPDAHCFCPMCSWVRQAPHLKTKKLVEADRRRARKMKVQMLEALARGAGVQAANEAAEAILADASLRDAVSMVTYGLDLIGRTLGQSSGPASLVLWREFAWDAKGSPKKKFELTADKILSGEKKLREAVAKAAGAIGAG